MGNTWEYMCAKTCQNKARFDNIIAIHNKQPKDCDSQLAGQLYMYKQKNL